MTGLPGIFWSRSGWAAGALLVVALGSCGPPGEGAAAPAAGAAGAPAGAAAVEPPPAVAARELAEQESFVPRRLVLPSGRAAPVVTADLASDGTLAVPADPRTVGWWVGGARAGDPYGTVVVAGHVDSRRYGIGVLAELGDARPGGVLRLEAGPRSRSYRVVSVRRVPKARLAAGTDTFAQDGAPRLALVTCGGRFDPATHTYADNVVVLARPVD